MNRRRSTRKSLAPIPASKPKVPGSEKLINESFDNSQLDLDGNDKSSD